MIMLRQLFCSILTFNWQSLRYFIIKNVSSSTSHQKKSLHTSLLFTSICLYVHTSLRPYVCTRIYKNNSGHILHENSEVVKPAMQIRVTRRGLGKIKDKGWLFYMRCLYLSGLCLARKTGRYLNTRHSKNNDRWAKIFYTRGT